MARSRCESRTSADSPSAITASEIIFFPSDQSQTETEQALSQALLSPSASGYREEAGLHNGLSGDRIVFEDDLTVQSQSQRQEGNGSGGNDELFDVTSILRSNSRRRSSRSNNNTPELNGLNYLNCLTYALHLFVSWGVGVYGLDGMVETRINISLRYETLVTPSTWAYIIWYPILLLEAVFAVAQLLPNYRGRPIVQAGTGYFFFYTFVIQTAWTLFFAFELFIFSFVAVVAALCSLLKLLASQHDSLTRGGNKRTEYYFFRFPFYLHTGWMIVVTLHHFSLMFRSHNADKTLQLAVDIFCLGMLMPVALIPLFSLAWKDFVIPFVVIWSYAGIACQLISPSQKMVDMFGDTIIGALKIATFFFAGTVGCCLIPNIVVWIFREFCTINVVELE